MAPGFLVLVIPGLDPGIPRHPAGWGDPRIKSGDAGVCKWRSAKSLSMPRRLSATGGF
jgi:hypothetical protein